MMKSLSQELATDGHFRELFNRGDEAAMQSFARSHLSTEIMTAIRDPKYPVDRFLALRPYITKEASLKKTNELAREAQTKLFPRYQKIFSQNPELMIFNARLNPEEFMEKDFFKNRVKSKPAKNQIDFFSRLRTTHPENLAVAEFYSDWFYAIVRDPVKNAELFSEYLTHFPTQAVPGYEEQIVTAYADLYSQKKNPIAQKTLDQLQKQAHLMPSERRLLVEYATKNPSVDQMAKMRQYLFPIHDGRPPMDLGSILESKDFSLKPDSKNSFDQSLQKLIRDRIKSANPSQFKPIGVTAYAKLIEENPSLAKTHLNSFYEFEFKDALRGHAEFPLQKTIHYLRKNLDPDLIQDFAKALTDIPLEQSRPFQIEKRFETLLPFFDLNSKEGATFVYRYASADQWKQRPELRKAIQKHFESLSQNPKLLLEEMKSISFPADIIAGNGDLSVLLSDRPDVLEKFTKNYVNLLDPKTRVLPPKDAARGADRLLRTYLQNPQVNPESAQEILKNWRVFVASEVSDPKVQEIAQRFETWIQKQAGELATRGQWTVPHHQKISACDWPEAIRYFFIKN